MSKKAKVAKGKKDAKPSNPIKEIIKQNQIVSDLLKIELARSEDIILTQSLFDEVSKAFRSEFTAIKPSLIEVLTRETSRKSEENSLLGQLKCSKLDLNFHKKKFEKSVKKIMMINARFEQKPNNFLLSSTEIHTHKIMGILVSDENIKVSIYKKNQVQGSKPDVSDSVWYENYSRSTKIIDCMMIGDIIDVYGPVKFCVEANRKILNSLLEKIQESLKKQEKPEELELILSVLDEKDSSPEDFSTSSSLLSMFEGFNQKISRSMNQFIDQITKENSKPKAKIGRIRDTKFKTQRNLNYKSKPPCFPFSQIKDQKPKKFFDLKHAILKDKQSLEEKIKLIHSCRVIQNFIKKIKFTKFKKTASKIQLIQKWIRGHLARKRFLFLKTQKFRIFFFTQRLKHWYPLLVNKYRERKSKFNKQDYSKNLKLIIRIQKNIRGYLARKLIVYWKKVEKLSRSLRDFDRFHSEKLDLWKVPFEDENLALVNTRNMEDDLKSFISQNEAKGKKQTKSGLEELVKTSIKNDIDLRKNYLARCRINRLKLFEDKF